MRTAIPALLLVLALVMLGLGLRRAWLSLRGALRPASAAGDEGTPLVQDLAWALLLVLMAAGGIARAALP